MDNQNKTPNRLINEKSPYLLQHAYNPVDWYPWGEEAFDKAQREDKPVFLSVGYSTCHWCHVMEQESFEDQEVAELLNGHFIPIKVDRELRPDIDSIYMAVCQAMTGGGGWPMSVFLTPSQKPFYAGTYFPKNTAYGRIGFVELLTAISHKWKENKKTLLESAEELTAFVRQTGNQEESGNSRRNGTEAEELLQKAVNMYRHSFDPQNGGFGDAPKFPTAHNLLLLMDYQELFPDAAILGMVEKTLTQMYRGGIYDHVGGGFSRYSTDDIFLVPHFEKMLYDNALLIMAYAQAYRMTGKAVYGIAAEETASYIMREMTDSEGGFYSAQDADSEGEEGKYYTFLAAEILQVLGEARGREYNEFYGISQEGNFEGKNIPNQLHHESETDLRKFAQANKELYEYRKKRTQLHLDDKLLTSWNCLMIAGFATLYQVFGNEEYLHTAQKSLNFISSKLMERDILYVGYRDGHRMLKGFLDDYAFCIFALLRLYDVTLEKGYLEKAGLFLNRVLEDFADHTNGGFFLTGRENEQLILQPKETYDGAIPSGNSVMTYNLLRLSALCENESIGREAEKQIAFMIGRAVSYPMGHSFFLIALLQKINPPEHIVCVVKDKKDLQGITEKIGSHANIIILEQPTAEYFLLNDRTTYYICRNFSCLPPVNEYTKI